MSIINNLQESLSSVLDFFSYDLEVDLDNDVDQDSHT